MSVWLKVQTQLKSETCTYLLRLFHAAILRFNDDEQSKRSTAEER